MTGPDGVFAGRRGRSVVPEHARVRSRSRRASSSVNGIGMGACAPMCASILGTVMERDLSRRVRERAMIIFTMISVLSAAGCSSGDTANPTSGQTQSAGCPLTQSVADIVAPGLTENPGGEAFGCGYGGKSASVILTVILGSNYPGHTAQDLLSSSSRIQSASPGFVTPIPELGAGAFEHVDPDGVASDVEWIEGGRELSLIVVAPSGSQRALAAAAAIYEQLGGAPRTTAGGSTGSTTTPSAGLPVSSPVSLPAQRGSAIDVTGVDGTSYALTVWGDNAVTDCASHSYGRVMTFFLLHPCRRARRVLATLSLGGRLVVLSSVAVYEPTPDTEVGPNGSPSKNANNLSALEIASGAGGLNDLLREGVRVPGVSATRIPAGEAFEVEQQDDYMAVFDAFYAVGATTDQDRQLVTMERNLFPSASILRV